MTRGRVAPDADRISGPQIDKEQAMSKFVLVYKGGGMATTEAEQQAVMAQWMGWFLSLIHI